MNRVRALTGGLAAIMIMSNMAAVTAYAAEPETVAIEQTVEVTQEASAEETAPAAEESTENTQEAPAEESAPAAETTENTEAVPVEDTTPGVLQIGSELTFPVDDTASFDTKEINDGIALYPIVVDPIDITVESVQNDETAVEQVQAEAAPENEAVSDDTVAIASDTEGIAQAGNIEEPAATDTTESNIPGGVDEEALQKSAEYQANRILRETTEGKLWNKDTQFWMNNTYYLAEEMTDGYVYVTKVDRNSGDQTVVDVIPTQDLYAEGIHGCNLMDRYDSYKYNEKKAKEKAEEEEKERLRSVAKGTLDKISNMNILEINDYCQKLSTVNTKLANGTFQEGNEDETEEEKNMRETLEVLGIDMLKEALGTSIDKTIDMIPGADFVGGPVKDLIKNAMGLKEEKPDVLSAISEQTRIIENKLDDIFKKLKEGSTNAVTAGAYGTTLNNWETSMNNAKDSIKRIDNNKDYNEVDKLVRYASIIGGENDWNKADNNLITQMKQAAQVLIGGSQVDPKERSLYDLAYDSQKDECLFAGEAMQKCEKYVQDRTNRFVATCNVFIECLNVHKQVADLSQDIVDSMSTETRKIYDSIKSSKESINTIIDDVVGYIFRGYKDEKDMTDEEKKDVKENGKGVFAVATDYYNKDKTVFIDTGNKYVDLKDKLTVKKPSEYFEYGYHCENVTLMGKPTGEKKSNAEAIANKIYDHVTNNMNGSGLTTSDISKIRDWARKNKMTIKEYLAYCGFDVSNLEDGILVRGAYKNNHAAGASGYHVGSNEKISGSGHDCKKRDGRMVDWFKVFDFNKNNNDPWIGRDDFSGDWYYFFEME